MDDDGPIEAVLSSDQRGEPYNFSLWDLNTGAQIVLFKGSKSSPISNCLRLIDNNFFVTANDNILQVWSIYNRKCQDQKIFLPGRPTCLCISSCANYISVGIAEGIYTWQLHSGNLMSHTQRHYQTVTVLKMNHDGSFLFSAGEDGIVLIWPFADLISGTHHTGSLNMDASRRDIGVNEPRFTLQHHSSTITDLHVTNGGRLISVSLDSNVNIYSYMDGRRLYCVSMPCPLYSVIMDKNETILYVGAKNGTIYEVAVSSINVCKMNLPGQLDGAQKKPLLAGHKDKVTCMELSVDGMRLVSGSNDGTCKIWDTRTNKLLRDIKHQAPIANLASVLVPKALALATMSKIQVKPPFKVKSLKRSVFKYPKESTVVTEDFFEETSSAIVNVDNKTSHFEVDISQSLLNKHGLAREQGRSISNNLCNSLDEAETIGKLRTKIQQLYKYSAEKIFKDAAMDSSLSFCPE